MPDRYLFYLFLFTLAWAPLPAGSNWPWAWELLQLLVFSNAFAWLLLFKQNKVAPTRPFKKAKPVIIMFGVWLGWIFLQLIPLPIDLVSAVSPHSVQLTLNAVEAIGQSASFVSISVDAYQTFNQFVLSAALVTFFMLSLVLLNTRKRIKIVMWVVIYSALFQSVFGSLMTLSGVEYHLFGAKEYYLDVATGTFINRNHLAGYLVMSLAIGIGLLLSEMKNKVQHSIKQLIRDLAELVLSKKMQLRIILAILVIGLVLTHSRMGNSAFFTSLLVCSFLWIFLSGRKPQKKVIILFVSLIVIDLLIVGAWFGFEKVVDRLEGTSIKKESRDEVVKSLLIAIPEFGFSGSGLGTFKTVYPSYKDDHIRISYLDAHNDYLQFALEGGVAVLLLFAIVMIAQFKAYKAMRTRKDSLFRGVGYASLMGVMAILIHSTVDFNLQIPANAMMFMLLLSLAWLGCYSERRSSS